jgi:chromate reductase
MPTKILGVCGSLRKQSFNRWALQAAQKLAPADITLDAYDIAGLPLFNQDEEQNPPPKVVDFKAKIRAADAILFVTPEYNYSIPGVLKNAIDWASRPPNVPMYGKPCAMMGAGGRVGTARAQYHLRQVCVFLDLKPINKPEVIVVNAPAQFDAEGNIKDEAVKTAIKDLLANLYAWTVRLRG